MKTRSQHLQAILGIAAATSRDGDGVSLRQALSDVDYPNARQGVSAADLAPILKADPDLVEQWLRRCEDKRTSGGWYVKRDGEVGQLSRPDSHVSFDTIEEAVAEYVLKGMDYWMTV